MKMNANKALRGRVGDFYRKLLQCKPLESPAPDLDLFEFDCGFVVGVFFTNDETVLSEEDHLKATWLEIKTKDPVELRKKLFDFGVKPIDYQDKTRFYFQAPGGQVFRLASEDGGI